MFASPHARGDVRPHHRPTWPSFIKNAERVAAAIAAGLILVAAAMPEDDRDASAPAAAPPASSSAFHPGRETNFGAYLGAPYHYPSDFWFRKDGLHDFRIKNVEWYTQPFDNPLYYGVRLQRWFSGGRIGSMIDFVHSKAYAPKDKEAQFDGTLDGKPAPEKSRIEDYFSKLEYSHGHNMLTLNGLLRFSSIGRISPYAGLGAGVLLPHAEIHLKSDPARTYEYQFGGPTAQALFGLEFRLKSGSVFLEYKYTFADYSGPITHTDGSWLPLDLWRQFSRWWSGEEPPGGYAGARIDSHQVVGGFLMRFVPAEAGVATP